MTDRAPHPSAPELVALLDEALPEGEARALRSHFERCDACRARADELEGLVHRLARAPALSSARVSAIVDAATATKAQPRPRPALLLAPLGAAVAAALLVFLALPADRPALQARGDDERAPPEVHLLLHAVLSPDGQQSARLADGDVIQGDLALSPSLQALPGEKGRYAAVFARDANGRVTWLLPSWLSPDDAPRCLVVPDGPAVLGPGPAVLLEDLPEGALEVAVLVFDGPCALPAIDAALESGARPSAGAIDGLLLTERLTLFVRRVP